MPCTFGSTLATASSSGWPPVAFSLGVAYIGAVHTGPWSVGRSVSAEFVAELRPTVQLPCSTALIISAEIVEYVCGPIFSWPVKLDAIFGEPETRKKIPTGWWWKITPRTGG